MPRRVAITNLNASTRDIINTIRANLGSEYQNSVPYAQTDKDIVAVGEVLCGYPNLANQFLSSLVNRIALTRIKSAVFNNAYAKFKKGYLEFGETVYDAFVNIAKAREFSPEKAEQREFKRTIPDVRTAFYVMNWRVQYPITIQDEDLRMAFTSINGVQDMIARIITSVTTAAEYDEYLLFKYLLIKGITSGKMYPVSVDTTDLKNLGVAFRGVSNELTFMKTKFNASGVTTTTPKNNQYIFMDTQLNAKYDVNVLASAFNMDKADFMGRLQLIDSWDEFDNDRFSEIISASDMIKPVTDEELALMKKVKAVLVDDEWFQVYDNLDKFTETYVASGTYWNYFYNVWKTVATSPFSNAVVFVDDNADISMPNNIEFGVTMSDISGINGNTIITLTPNENTPKFVGGNYEFVQSVALANMGIAVHKYGAIIIPNALGDFTFDVVVKIGDTYYSATINKTDVSVGNTISFTTETNCSSLLGVSVDGADYYGSGIAKTFVPSMYVYTMRSEQEFVTFNVWGSTPYVPEIECNNSVYSSGDNIPLDFGVNVITIKVNAFYETKVYTFYVTRVVPENDTDLSTYTRITNITADTNLTLNTVFDADNYDYTFTGKSGNLVITVSPDKTSVRDVGFSVICKRDGEYEPLSTTNGINLYVKDTNNVVEISCTYFEDGSTTPVTKTYTFTRVSE